MRKTVFLDTCHRGAIGGGENYLMRFAIELNKHADVYVRQNWDYQFKIANGFYETFPIFDNSFKPDICIQSNYNYVSATYGKYNFLITFFPNSKFEYIDDFNEIITICDYSAKYVKEFWNRKSTIIHPSIDTTQYFTADKRNQIVSIGHFFQEPDGHSKNQHVLIEAMQQLSNYKLVLIGNCYNDNLQYLHKCQDMCSGLDIEFVLNTPAQRVRDILSESKFLWHANGYGRTNPAQVEHFGIVVLEALASKCIPIVHGSGGARDIQGAYSWNTVDELIEVTKHLESINQPIQFPEQYTLPYFNTEVASWLNKLL